MTTITKQQSLKRWDTLPDDLREFLFADTTTQMIDVIFESLHIPAEKQPPIRRIVGLSLMGFIHTEDVAKEIQDATGINSQHARELADSISIKIFSPFRVVLEKIYALPEAEPIAPTRPSFDSVLAPKTVVTLPTTAPKSLESLTAKPAPAPAAKSTVAPPPTQPAFTAVPAALPGLSTIPSKSASATPFVPAAPAAPRPTPAPAPFVIQTETKVSPIIQAPKFTMESLGKTTSAFGTNTSAFMAPPKVAQVEIGNLSERSAAPSGIVGKFESSPRVIHYGGPSTPLPGAPSSPSGPVSMGSLQGGVSSPRPATFPSPFVPPPAKPSVPSSPDAGSFIKTMITPKDEKLKPGPVPPPPSPK
jgi:hypothetical protein